MLPNFVPPPWQHTAHTHNDTFTQVFIPAASVTRTRTLQKYALHSYGDFFVIARWLTRQQHMTSFYTATDDAACSTVLKPAIRNTLCRCIEVQKLGNNSKKIKVWAVLYVVTYRLTILLRHYHIQTGTKITWHSHLTSKRLSTLILSMRLVTICSLSDSKHSRKAETMCLCTHETENISNCADNTHKYCVSIFKLTCSL